MNKSQLVDAIAKEAAITKVEAKKALDAFIAVTGTALKSGEIKLPWLVSVLSR